MPTTKMEFSGKDVNAAIENACKTLSSKREQLNIEIVSPGSSGIFGLGRRQAKILVSRKAVDIPAAAPLEPQSEETRPIAGRQTPSAGAESRPPAEKKAPGRMKERREETDEGDELTPEVLEGARTALAKLLALMDFSAEVSLSRQGRKIVAHLTGDQVGELVGEEGQVLDSLQYLLRKMLSKQFQKKIMVSIEAGDYRANRKAELERLALDTAAEVKATGKTRTLAALNPAERRVVHVTLQNDETVRSKSVGDGLFKKILIFPADADRKKPPGRRRPRGPRQGAKKS